MRGNHLPSSDISFISNGHPARVCGEHFETMNKALVKHVAPYVNTNSFTTDKAMKKIRIICLSFDTSRHQGQLRDFSSCLHLPHLLNFCIHPVPASLSPGCCAWGFLYHSQSFLTFPPNPFMHPCPRAPLLSLYSPLQLTMLPSTHSPMRNLDIVFIFFIFYFLTLLPSLFLHFIQSATKSWPYIFQTLPGFPNSLLSQLPSALAWLIAITI